ncbi:MAG: hypothetical protein AAFY20_22900 [Cyanobacteria bacterium J06639_14]
MDLSQQRVDIPEWNISLGVWQGGYQGIERLWLRWFDKTGNVISTAEERADRLAQRLKELGIDPDKI